MTTPSEHPTPERLQAVAQQTYDAIRQREHFLARLLKDRNELHAVISDCVKVVSEADPSGYSESEFKDVLVVMGRVIDALEEYFTKHGNPKDVAQCYFLGHALKSLKDSRHWIAQGLSPDPEKRPSPAERQRMSDELAAEMFGAGLKPA